ncbi:shikimate dehydrogenase [Anaerofilum sp. BX8]|uniref:Shikimate kinase n=1 Tax=Anaerofilum hominis TaxID=2763016 RepID=A0A923KXD2_9FIRM|nr:shikimate kinase [Anaerofilum hominis]MBC5580419.1 shikimate dehydrogenase [Anaerofilum hominis]
METQRYGLIGEHLGHSFSKSIHEQLADYTYDLIELAPQQLAPFFAGRQFAALNVTIPYKEAVLPLLDEVDPRAAEIGAVNTVVNRGGKLTGYNTDYDGVDYLLHRHGILLGGRVVMILGTGGTSKTCAALARAKGAKEVLLVSRSGKGGALTYHDAAMRRDVQVLLNTTPCGMYPDNDGLPMDPALFPRLEAAADVVYNPLQTAFVLRALDLGLPAAGGLEMLVAQAKTAAELFLGRPLPDEEIGRVHRRLQAERANCVLIAMPGAGKTTVGGRAARMLGKTFVDTDDEITAYAGRTPAQIIEQDGEAAFREIESRVIAEIAKKGGQLIATGGGAVTRAENMRRLRQNGVILFIDRELSLLATSGRPLSRDFEALRQRYIERYPLYNRYCDLKLDNDETIETAARRVEEAFYAYFGA